MNEKYLEYALEHLERELDIVDNPYLCDYDENEDRVKYIDNPEYVEGVHDRPQYRAEIVKDLHDIKQILGG